MLVSNAEGGIPRCPTALLPTALLAIPVAIARRPRYISHDFPDIVV